MKQLDNLIALGSGSLFALGLAVSGMTQPQKVQGFLDLFGNWDPSLAFVMGGAVVANLVLFRWVLRRDNPIIGDVFHLPTRKDVDGRLIFGAALFGIGWGLAGLCPGPALVNVGAWTNDSVTFALAMIAGMVLFGLSPLNGRRR